jgi:hypothetical protein
VPPTSNAVLSNQNLSPQKQGFCFPKHNHERGCPISSVLCEKWEAYRQHHSRPCRTDCVRRTLLSAAFRIHPNPSA